jgi:hypothetical protein
MNSQIQPLLDLLSGHAGWLPQALVWIGALRLALRFFNERLLAWLTVKLAAAAQCPGGDADTVWHRVLGSKSYRVFAFTIDLLFSIKLPSLADYLAELAPPRT